MLKTEKPTSCRHDVPLVKVEMTCSPGRASFAIVNHLLHVYCCGRASKPRKKYVNAYYGGSRASNTTRWVAVPQESLRRGCVLSTPAHLISIVFRSSAGSYYLREPEV